MSKLSTHEKMHLQHISPCSPPQHTSYLCTAERIQYTHTITGLANRGFFCVILHTFIKCSKIVHTTLGSIEISFVVFYYTVSFSLGIQKNKNMLHQTRAVFTPPSKCLWLFIHGMDESLEVVNVNLCCTGRFTCTAYRLLAVLLAWPCHLLLSLLKIILITWVIMISTLFVIWINKFMKNARQIC